MVFFNIYYESFALDDYSSTLTLSLLERPKAANRKCDNFPRAAKSGQDIFFDFTLPQSGIIDLIVFVLFNGVLANQVLATAHNISSSARWYKCLKYARRPRGAKWRRISAGQCLLTITVYLAMNLVRMTTQILISKDLQMKRNKKKTVKAKKTMVKSEDNENSNKSSGEILKRKRLEETS